MCLWRYVQRGLNEEGLPVLNVNWHPEPYRGEETGWLTPFFSFSVHDWRYTITILSEDTMWPAATLLPPCLPRYDPRHPLWASITLFFLPEVAFIKYFVTVMRKARNRLTKVTLLFCTWHQYLATYKLLQILKVSLVLPKNWFWSRTPVCFRKKNGSLISQFLRNHSFLLDAANYVFFLEVANSWDAGVRDVFHNDLVAWLKWSFLKGLRCQVGSSLCWPHL